MIKRMITLDPVGRPTFDVLLHTARGTVFPESFYSFLHNYAASVNDLPGASPFAAPLPGPTTLAPATKTPAASVLPQDSAASAALPSDSDNRIDRVWSEFDGVEAYLVPEILDEQPAVKVEWTPPNSSSVSAWSLEDFLVLIYRRICFLWSSTFPTEKRDWPLTPMVALQQQKVESHDRMRSILSVLWL